MRNLVLFSKDDIDRTFAEKVAETAGIKLNVFSDAEEMAKFLAHSEPTILFIDIPSKELYLKIEDAIQKQVGLFSDKVSSNHTHFLSSLNLEEVPFLIQSPLFGNFVQKKYGDVAGSGIQYGRLIKASLNDRAFGISQYFASGIKVQNIPIQITSQKQDAVEAVRTYLLAAKFHGRIATVIANAVDELLMNAMFDAPVDDLGKPLFSNVSRSSIYKLDGKGQVEMNIGFDGETLAFSAVDYYGSIDKTKLLNHISKVYGHHEYKVKSSVAGAGIGLATVFRMGGSFYFISENKVKTEVIVFFKRTDNYRQFKDQFRFISTQFYF